MITDGTSGSIADAFALTGGRNNGGNSGHGYIDQMIQNAPDVETRRVLEMARENLGRR